MSRKQQRILTGDEVMGNLMKPILTVLIKNDNQKKWWDNVKSQKDKMQSVLNWCIRSRYFLWVRHNPGKVPTEALIYQWRTVAELRTWDEESIAMTKSVLDVGGAALFPEPVDWIRHLQEIAE